MGNEKIIPAVRWQTRKHERDKDGKERLGK